MRDNGSRITHVSWLLSGPLMTMLWNSRGKPAKSGVTRNGDVCRLRSVGADAGVVRSLCRVLVAALLIAASGPVWGADDGGSCPSLTFRWTSGTPLRGDVVHPPRKALRHPPFLVDPEIVSVMPSDKGRFGEAVLIKLTHPAVDVLAAEVAKHDREQILIMLGNDFVFAPTVHGPMNHDEFALGGPPGNTLLAQWRAIQQQQQRCKR
jgi:hypothetical protein